MNLEDLLQIIKQNTHNIGPEFRRVFHGRGGLYDEYKSVTIDSINTILSVALFYENGYEAQLLSMLQNFVHHSHYETLLVQRRYIKEAPSEAIIGNLDADVYAIENGIKFKLNLLNNKNSGYFPDMKNGRMFVEKNAKGKNVLNLFSYTCGFSLFAARGEAKSIVNIDMNKNALSTGRSNHHLNNLNTRGVSFLPYNILKSFSRIKKKGPYDFIIIDPPTFQKGSFEATKDYKKIIAKLPEIASKNCTLLACLNSPDLNESFLKELIKELAPSFEFEKRLENLEEFASADEEKSLKNLIFQRR